MLPSVESVPKLQPSMAEECVGHRERVSTTVVGATVVAAEEGVILVEVVLVLLLFLLVVVVVTVVVATITVAELVVVNTTVTTTKLLATVITTETDGTALFKAELALLLKLTLLLNSKGSSTIILALAVVRAGAVDTSATARREQADSASIVSGASSLLLIVGSRERSLSANGTTIRNASDAGQVGRIDVVPQLWSVTVDLFHNNRVTEFGEKTVDALDCGIRHLALLQRTVHVPLLSNAALNKVDDELRADEIHESITDVKIVGEINTKV